MLIKVVVVSIIMIVLLFVSRAFICRVPPEALTKNSFTRLRRQIKAFRLRVLELPRSLSDLPPKAESHELQWTIYDPSKSDTLDGWGNKIIYTVVNDLEVTLLSCGADSKEGTNDDMSLNFKFKKVDSTGFLKSEKMPKDR